MENTKPIQNQEQQPKKNILLYCFLILAIGLIFGYFFIYQKVEEMKLGKEISYSYKAIALSSLCISMGLYFIFFRIKTDGKYTDLPPKDKKIFIGAAVFMVISVIATIVWFNIQMTKYGY
jgi:hypothetical protein